MNKILCALIGVFILGAPARAEIYQGIDIDDIYAKSDWNSKEEIKEMIDDYRLVQEYKTELNRCETEEDSLSCIGELGDKILSRFYSYTGEMPFFANNGEAYANVYSAEKSKENFQNYIRATFSAYEIIYCSNKYAVPPGQICEVEKDAAAEDIIKGYIYSLLQKTEKELNDYSFLKNYESNGE